MISRGNYDKTNVNDPDNLNIGSGIDVICNQVIASNIDPVKDADLIEWFIYFAQGYRNISNYFFGEYERNGLYSHFECGEYFSKSSKAIISLVENIEHPKFI
jgi:hypothetical protein